MTTEAKPRRPSIYDTAVIQAGVESSWPEIAAWFGDDAPVEESEVAKHKADLVEAFGRGEDDPYRVARRLERSGWDPDADLVEVIGSVAWKIHGAHKAAVRAWVAAGGVAADLPAGTKIRHRDLGGHVGEIVDPTGHDPRLDGKYVVFCAALGHKRAGSPEAAEELRLRNSVSTGIYVHAEDVEVVKEEEGRP